MQPQLIARCRQCNERGRPCAFHAVASPADLGRAVAGALRQFGSVGLAQFVESALAQLADGLPTELRAVVAQLDPAPLEQQFTAALSLEEFTPDDLRRLAAIALSLAIVDETEGA
jgi:hypothetical protein